jgi:hypothetical protein
VRDLTEREVVMRHAALALTALTTLTVLALPSSALASELSVMSIVPAQAGGEVKAVVVKSWSECGSGLVNWAEINSEWPRFGTTPVHIDYDAPGICDGPVTYDGLVASRADVLIISNPAGGGVEYSPEEVAAVTSYVREGHGIIGSYLFFLDGDTPVDDRGLLPLFGLPMLEYDLTFLHPTYQILSRASPLFAGLHDPFVSEGFPSTQTPPDGSWGPQDLAGARIVAKTRNSQAVVTVFHGRSFNGVYVSSMTEHQSGVVDAHFWYNAIVYAAA